MDNSNYIYEMKSVANKAQDSASVIKKENGYTLGVNSSNTIYLAFPGETEANPHMYLGKDTPENRKKAEEVFNSFKSIKHTKDDRTVDAGYVTTGRMVVRYAEDILREMGKNNSTGRYDRVVQGCRSLLGGSLLEGDKLKDAVRKEVERLLKKYNPNDARTVDKVFSVRFLTKNGDLDSKIVEAKDKDDAEDKVKEMLGDYVKRVAAVLDAAPIDRAIRATDEYNKYASYTDKQFLKESIAEMRRYERNWSFMTTSQKRDISPVGGLSELRKNIKQAEERLKELGG